MINVLPDVTYLECRHIYLKREKNKKKAETVKGIKELIFSESASLTIHSLHILETKNLTSCKFCYGRKQ